MSRHFVLSMHLLIGSVVISVASMTLVVRKGGYPWLSRKVAQLLHRQPPAPNNRISLFEQLTIESEDIVFLGDSILNSGEWNELLKCNRAKNRAIGEDDTHTILARLKPIIEAGPRHVVLHCGINNFQKGIPFAQTTAEYREIVSSLQSPHTDLWLIPVFPVNAYLYQRWVVADHPEVTRPRQSEVEALNRFIKSLASDNP